MASLFKFGIDEGLEELKRHLFGQTALVQLEVRANGNNRTARVVDALTKQVLTEAALLALDHVRERLERAAVGTSDGATTTTVVEQRVHSFLKHALFVADDDFGRTQFHQPFQTVVAVDDAAVQVVEVRGGKTATVKRNQRTQFRRNDRNNFHDHPFGLVVRFQKRFNDLEALGDLFLLGLALGGFAFFAQFGAQLFQLQFFQQAAHGFGAHAHGKHIVGAVVVKNLQVLVFRDDLALLQIGLTGVEHDVRVEIEHLFQVGHGHVEQGTDLGGQGLQKPDVGNGRGQFNVAHTLAAHLGGNNFNAALFADNATVLHALVLAAVAFIVLHGAEDLGAEQAVALRLEGTVIDGFRLFHFAIRPFTDSFGRCDGNLDGFQVADVRHVGRRAACGEKIVQAHSIPCFVKSSLKSLAMLSLPAAVLPQQVTQRVSLSAKRGSTPLPRVLSYSPRVWASSYLLPDAGSR